MSKFLSLISIFFISFISLFKNVLANVRPKEIMPPSWAVNRVIYEVNVRQFSQEGTFKQVQEALPLLKDMGVGIIWLMPIHPIGVKERKGTLGSYYSVSDYQKINPEFGNENDFRSLVNKAHQLDIKVIIDWVANHTAWDHTWVKEGRLSLYKCHGGCNGENFVIPGDGMWTDVITLNFENPELRELMYRSMEYWVLNFDVDGFRCDVAYEVPTSFWNMLRSRLDNIKPVFMLAEAEVPELHQRAFDMSYAWEMKDILNNVAAHRGGVSQIWNGLLKQSLRFPKGSIHMQFTTNHDENSHNGHVFERLGDMVPLASVFTFLVPGMPLIYNGQEAGMSKRLKFFEKDQIIWQNHYFRQMFSKLSALKRDHRALDAGIDGGEIKRLFTSNNNVLAFTRSKDKDEIVALLNFSDKRIDFKIEGPGLNGVYLDAFTDYQLRCNMRRDFFLNPWGFLIIYKKR